MNDTLASPDSQVYSVVESGAFPQADHVARNDESAIAELWSLLVQRQFDLALQSGRQLCARGAGHPAVFLALAFGGVLFGDRDAATLGRRLLTAWADANSDRQQLYFYQSLIKPLLPHLLGPAFYSGDHARVLEFLSVMTAAVVTLRPLFESTATVAELDLDAMRRRGVARAKLIPFAADSASVGRQRRVVVGMRDLVFPGQPNSRPHEVPPRLNASFRAYGWSSELYPMAWQNLYQDFRAVAELIEQTDADLLILDDQLIEYPHVRPIRADFLRQIREQRPSIQIVGVLLDAWSIEDATLRSAAELVDLVWSMAPAREVWREPALATKCFFSPFPYAAAAVRAPRPLIPRLRFSGGVLGYNWHRAFWLSSAEKVGLPIETRLAAHTHDGLSAAKSTELYMEDLANSTCSLNFAMRPDLSRIATGRCFETCLVGSLLVQEFTEDLDYYLIPGEHYLEFTTLDELLQIMRLLETRPDEAEEVRRRGAEFAYRYYRNDQIVGKLQQSLESLPDR